MPEVAMCKVDQHFPLQTWKRISLLKFGALFKLIYYGKNKMPGYGINCTPKGQCTFAARLSDEQIIGLSEYALQQAKNGW
eukprot:jgi/Botrbrau1/22327/Bobra.0002s0007.1